MALDARRYVDPVRWRELARHDEEAWLARLREETPTERFDAPERWALQPTPRSPEGEREDYLRHVRVAAVLARVRSR